MGMARGSALQNVLTALEKTGSRVRPHGGYYMAQCPAHDDGTASLSVSQGDQKAVMNCHAGCTVDDIRIALELPWPALFDNDGNDKGRQYGADLWMPCQAEKRKPNDPEPCTGHKSAEYRYTDEDGNFLYAVARCSRKGDGCPQPFAQWIPDSTKRYGKKWGLPSTVRRVLYDLPRVIQAAREGRRIWILEGEKDVERMKADFPDEVATTPMSGAGKNKWRREYTKHFAGASEVIIVADCDEPGLAHAEDVHSHVGKVVDKVKVVCSPLMSDGADFTDHRDYGFGLDEFEVVPFETVTRRPQMVIQVEERHREEPITFQGYDQTKLEKSLVGSMLKYGFSYEMSGRDFQTDQRLVIAVDTISKIAARENVITPETVAVEIEAQGKGSYEQALAFLAPLEDSAFSDTQKPKKAAKILRERTVREGVVLTCRVLEEFARNERWGVGQVLTRMRDMADRSLEEYASLARTYDTTADEGAFTEDDFTGDVVEEIAREEGIALAEPGGAVVRELRPSARHEASAARSG